MIDLNEAERIGKAATGEPWEIDDYAHDADSRFAAYARNHWQPILDELAKLRELLRAFGRADIALDDKEVDASATEEEIDELVERHGDALEKIKAAAREYAGVSP